MILIFGFMVFSVYYIAKHDKKLLGPKIVQIIDIVKTKVGLQEIAQDRDIYCAFHSLTPEPGSHVKSSVNISVLIDNTNTDCAPWVVFEGQAGTVSLYNENDKLLDTGVLTTTSDWTTGFPVTYSASLSNFVYTGRVKLVFTEENPSGQGHPKKSFITFFVD